MFKRAAAHIIETKFSQYPILALMGPRQAGKSTLAKSLFPNKPYCSLEDLDHRKFANEDPRGFLNQYPHGAVLDEVQNTPELFSYLQTIVDSQSKTGLFILTGSQQFNLTTKITQSLAGRVGIIQLLPLSIHELQQAKVLPNLDQLIYTGFYPRIYDKNIPPQIWLSDYVMTYVERDIRQLIAVKDLIAFDRFVRMCAARTGQILNLSSLANDCGITHNTAKAWISVLVASYIIFLVTPHFNNYNKRLIKAPKLYFFDTGLACLLMGIRESAQIATHVARGALFETLIAADLIKQRFNAGLFSNLYFWRDSQGHEVDLIIENGNDLIPVEIKSGQTISTDYFKGIEYWRKLSLNNEKAWVIYAGDQSQSRQSIDILNWQQISTLN